MSKLGSTITPFPPAKIIKPFFAIRQDRSILGGLTATSQRPQSSRDGQGGDAKKHGPGSLTI